MAERNLTIGEGAFTQNDAMLLVDLVKRAQGFLSSFTGMPPALEQMTEIRQQQQELSASGAPLTEVLRAGTNNPALGFGAGILKGPGPTLRLMQGGVPTGVERVTRMQPRFSMKQEIHAFPVGGKANSVVVRRSRIKKDAAREERTKNQFTKANLILERRRGEIMFSGVEDGFKILSRQDSSGNIRTVPRVKAFKSLEEAEEFILNNPGWFGPELPIFKE